MIFVFIPIIITLLKLWGEDKWVSHKCVMQGMFRVCPQGGSIVKIWEKQGLLCQA